MPPIKNCHFSAGVGDSGDESDVILILQCLVILLLLIVASHDNIYRGNNKVHISWSHHTMKFAVRKILL